MILYFSGCGNSGFVAEELGKALGEKVMPLLELGDGEAMRLELSEGEALGIVCPIYAWAVPRVVEAALERLQLNAKPAYCYLACTCGDNIGEADKKLAKILERRGLTLDAAFSFVMPETYINLAGFNLDTPEGEQRKIAAVRERLPQVAERIARREKATDVVRGKMPGLKSGLINRLFYSLLITDRKFHATEACTHCGRCAKECQFGNIELREGTPHWLGHCTNCMACYHHCPVNAIHFGKATVGKGQYYFGRNTIKEAGAR